MKKRYNQWVKRSLLLKVIYETGIAYASPANFTYWWNFGGLAFVCLLIQIVTGLFLAMHYNCDMHLAFASVEHITRDVNFGWLIRYSHSNGASIFFFIVYIHIMRGLYHNSFMYPRQLLWISGIIIFLLMIITSFLGYVLPWGQMSFWAATVITSLVTAIPYIGTDIVYVLWGGFSVDNATLNRFFSLHFFLPFLILALSIVHVLLLHEHGSTNPLGIISKVDSIPFSPYYTIKDGYTIFILFILFSILVFFYPNLLGHSDNYILGNPMVTPPHIVPEWYFLPFYAILRSVPDKLIGFLLLLLSIIILLLLPFLSGLNMIIKSGYFKPGYKFFIIFFFFNWLILGWIGGQPIASPYYEIGQIATIFYFVFFTGIVVILNFFEFYQIYYYSYSKHYSKSDKFFKGIEVISPKPFVERLPFMVKWPVKFVKEFCLMVYNMNILNWLHTIIWILIITWFIC